MDKEKLVKKALDEMHSIEKVTCETVALCSLNDDNPPYGEILSAVHGTSGLSYHFEVGFRFPLHTSAPGKAILAYLPENECEKLVSKIIFTRFTKSTITNQTDFYAELKEVRNNGYAIDVSEQIEGCHCIGVPILDKNGYPIAGLWTTGVASNMPVRSFAKFAKLLMTASKEISIRMAGKGRNSDRKYINQIVQKAEIILQENTNCLMDMEELAHKLYVGYSWFRKAFKSKTGLSPSQYHLKYRINKAKELLLSTEMPVKQISDKLGFESQHNFSALFKKKCGLSPKHFREEGR